MDDLLLMNRCVKFNYKLCHLDMKHIKACHLLPVVLEQCSFFVLRIAYTAMQHTLPIFSSVFITHM